ncbi:MAG: flagellar hook-associated protein FlgK [Sulfuricella sp.]|nr:flagellar hook-associated protein FlgK [Sulfuricella sp.]
MGNSIFGIGLSGLNAAQVGLVTTGHNISNANTAGFHRQEVVQATNIPEFTGAGFIGQGTHVDTVKRLYNQFLDTQVSEAQTKVSLYDSYSAQIKQIDNLVADTTSGLSPALQDFFTAVNDVAATPASVPSRQSMLSGAQSLISRLQGLSTRFTEMRDSVNGQIRSSVDLINNYSAQIATFNERIALASSASPDRQVPNDLLDQREQLVADLNKEVKTTVVKQDDGSINVFVGSGQPLVVGQQVQKLVAVQSPYDPERLEVGLQAGSSSILLGQGLLQGGSLSGLLAFRNEALDSAQNALGRVAIGLAQTFNDQHKLGQDLNNDLGGDFFNVPLPKVIPKLGNDPALTADVTISNAGGLTVEDYNLLWDGAAWKLNRVSDGAAVTMSGTGVAGDPFVADGMSIIVGGAAPAAGNGFQIQPTRNGARDLSLAITDTAKIAAAAPVLSTVSLATNIGSGTMTQPVVNTTAPVTPDPAHPSTDLNLKNQVTINFTSATTFDVTDAVNGVLATGVAYTAGADISYNGWTAKINGSPATGDTFTVGANPSGVSDSRNAVLLAELQSKNTLGNGTTTYQGVYSQMVSAIGNKAREVAVNGAAQQNLLDQASQAQQSMSGVNLDEEAANLIRYQQAYQASGKMIQIATTMFQTLINLGG